MRESRKPKSVELPEKEPKKKRGIVFSPFFKDLVNSWLADLKRVLSLRIPIPTDPEVVFSGMLLVLFLVIVLLIEVITGQFIF